MLTQEEIDNWSQSEQYYNSEEDAFAYQKTPMDMVAEFCKVTGQTPTPSLYVKLIGEEFDEWTKEGMIKSETDLKELADLVYVLYGYALAMGYNLDEAVRRVHENNVGRCVQPCDNCNQTGWVHADIYRAKCPECGGKGTYVERRIDGKIVKNKDYPKVDLGDLM